MSHQVSVASSGVPLARGFPHLPRWLSASLVKASHGTRSTVSHFPVGLEHLDNTIETDRLSLVLLVCVWEEQRLDAGSFFSTESVHYSSPCRDKRAAMLCHSSSSAEIIE